MPLRKEESKTKKILFTAVIGFVLISSIIGFTYSSLAFNLGTAQSDTVKYGDREFVRTQLGLGTVVDGLPLEFFYYPEDLGSTDASRLTGVLTASRSVYATSHPNSSFSSQISGFEFELARVLDSQHNIFLDTAFTAPNRFGKQVVTCGDATPFVPVLFFNFTNSTTEIMGSGNCVIVNFASQNAFDRIRDKTLYTLLGVEP